MTLFKYYIPILGILLVLLLVKTADPLMVHAAGIHGKMLPYTAIPDSLEPAVADTLPVTAVNDSVSSVLTGAIMATDSLATDSVATDTVPKKKKAALDAAVSYSSKDSIIWDFDSVSNKASLYGESEVNYIISNLKAENIYINMDSSTVYAVGSLDSTGVTTFGNPLFTEGTTPYLSKSMHYNFKTKKGFIRDVFTEQEGGYITSYSSKKDSLDNLYMKHGVYTTCDNKEHPHFYFHLSRGKVIPGKNVVFGPAYLVVEDVPLPIGIPFGFFPFTSSYSSGFIMPSYGDEMQRGFYLSDGGYYWAISDRMDLKLTGQIYTKGSWGVNAASNYNVRYKYAGNFNFSYLYSVTGEKNMPDYYTSRDLKIQWGHRQDPRSMPNSSFSASVNFSTSSYEHSNVSSYYNPGVFSQNTKTSSVYYTRSFPDQKLTMSTGLNISQISKDSTISVSFPGLSVSVSSMYPFRRKKRAGEERWYEKVNLRYSGLLGNSITTKEDKLLKSNLIKDWQNGVKQEIPVSASFTLFNYLNITPSFSYTERWYSHKINQSRASASAPVEYDTIYGFNRVYNYSGSLAFSTKLYGMYTPIRSIMGEKIRQIRHVFTPSITLSAAPDFGARSYGYYKTYSYIDAYGNEQTVEYSPFAGQLYGVPNKGKTGSIGMNISNNLEMKVAKRDTIKKVSLIDDLGLGLSYNMAAQTRPWSDLSMRLRLKLTSSYTFNLSTTFATYAYQFDENGNVYVGDRTEWSYGRFGRFSGTSFSYSYTFNNGTWKKWFKPKVQAAESDQSTPLPGIEKAPPPETDPTKQGGHKEKSAEMDEDGYEVFSIPWSFSLSYSCRISENRNAKINPENMRYPYRLNHTLSGSGNVKISNKWDLSFSTAYDFDANEIATTTFNVTRDLHCFSILCNITPFGRWKSYNFVIRAKSNLLQDLKWEQRSTYANNVQWY